MEWEKPLACRRKKRARAARFHHASVVTCALVGASSFASAATFTWSGNGANANWSTGANWAGTAPASATSTTLVFTGATNTGSLATPLNNDIANPMLMGTIIFNNSTANFFLGG